MKAGGYQLNTHSVLKRTYKIHKKIFKITQIKYKIYLKINLSLKVYLIEYRSLSDLKKTKIS